MKSSLKMLSLAVALLIACTALTGCGGKKSDDKTTSPSDVQTVSIDHNEDVDSQIDSCKELLDETESLPNVAKKSVLEALHDHLDSMSKRGDLTEEQSKQVSELLDQVNEKLKDTADVDLNNPDLKLSDLMG